MTDDMLAAVKMDKMYRERFHQENTSKEAYEECALLAANCLANPAKIWPNFRIVDQHLLLIWADLHVFYTILTAMFGLNNFCSDM